MAASDKQAFGWTPRILNASIAGIVGVTCVFPIDLVKTRLQNQQVGPNGQRMYKSMYDCGKKTFRNEGFVGMYRGAGVNLLLITPEKAIKLVINDFLRHRLRNKQGVLTNSGALLAGAGAGACQIVVTTPMELLKIQLQDAGRSASKTAEAMSTGAQQSRQYSTGGAGAAKPKISASNIAMALIKEKGVLGLYKGMGPTFLRDVIFSAIYFPLFAHLNSVGKRRDAGTAVFYVSLVAGIIAGGVASFCVNPFDVVKTRLQTLTKGHGETQYTGIVDCFAKTMKNEGWRAFFKGGACRMAVIAPLFGIAQVVYYVGIAEYMMGIEKVL